MATRSYLGEDAPEHWRCELRLVPITADDEDLAVRLECDPEMMLHIGGPRPEADVRAAHKRRLDLMEKGEAHMYKVVADGCDEVLGVLSSLLICQNNAIPNRNQRRYPISALNQHPCHFPHPFSVCLPVLLVKDTAVPQHIVNNHQPTRPQFILYHRQ